jgi:hypothetical protein
MIRQAFRKILQTIAENQEQQNAHGGLTPNRSPELNEDKLLSFHIKEDHGGSRPENHF